MLDAGKFAKENERVIESVRDALVATMLQNGHTVIVDDTNLNPKHENRLRSIAANGYVPVEVRSFDVPLHECLARNALRPSPVPAHVIKNMHKKWLAQPQSFTYAEQDESLPHATIFDIDGTLAFNAFRGPYEHDKAFSDLCNIPVAGFVDLSRARGKIVYLSGRSAEWRDITLAWLERFKLLQDGDLVLMRARDDKRDDAIIKRELYERHVKGQFYVRAVFDDRDKVVAMWREIGLPCFQVRPGDF